MLPVLVGYLTIALLLASYCAGVAQTARLLCREFKLPRTPVWSRIVGIGIASLFWPVTLAYVVWHHLARP